MFQTIEVEIDYSGYIHPRESMDFMPAGRALLTFMEPISLKTNVLSNRGNVENTLALLATSRYVNASTGNLQEVQERINLMRNEWDGK